MQKLFDPDGGFSHFTARLSQLVWLNILSLVCSLPVVTFGASSAALYTVLLHLLQESLPVLQVPLYLPPESLLAAAVHLPEQGCLLPASGHLPGQDCLLAALPAVSVHLPGQDFLSAVLPGSLPEFLSEPPLLPVFALPSVFLPELSPPEPSLL